MTLQEKRVRASTMRAAGALLREIAVELGTPRSTVSQWLSDPDGSKSRARKERYRLPCADGCGRLLNGSDGMGPNRSKRCFACAMKVKIANQRALAECINQCVVLLWKNGKTRGEIGEAMGWSPKSASAKIVALRTAGYDIPYRRTPEQLARIGASRERMEHARTFKLARLAA